VHQNLQCSIAHKRQTCSLQAYHYLLSVSPTFHSRQNVVFSAGGLPVSTMHKDSRPVDHMRDKLVIALILSQVLLLIRCL